MIAFGPAYLVDYFRHDDFASACWDRISITTHHIFNQAVYNEVRPYTMIFMYYSELFTEYLSGAKYIKIATIAIFSLSSLLLFKWLRIFNTNKLWALFLAIILFTLPPMQIMASTYHYFFMAIPVLLSSIIIFIVWDIQNKNYNNIGRVLKFILFLQLITFLTFYNKFMFVAVLISMTALFLYYRCKDSNIEKRSVQFLYFSAFVIYLISITAYPPSAMFVWFFLAVALLAIFKSDNPKKIINFSIKVFVLSILAMIAYFVLGKLLAFGLNINMNTGRGLSLTGDISKLFVHTLDAVRVATNLWDIREMFTEYNGGMFNDFDKLIFIFSTFLLALLIIIESANKKYVALVLLSILILICLAISPAVVSHNSDTMYRYIIALTPLIGYIFFWSLAIFFSYNNKYYKYFLTTVLGTFFIGVILLTNYNIFKTIVEPNQYEMNYMAKILDQEVMPKIKNNEKVLIKVVIGKMHYTKQRYSRDEHGKGLSNAVWTVNLAMVMLLKDRGIETTSSCIPKISGEYYSRFENNWGIVEVFTDTERKSANAPKEDYILIDFKNNLSTLDSLIYEDDQSVYKWKGTEIENIENLQGNSNKKVSDILIKYNKIYNFRKAYVDGKSDLTKKHGFDQRGINGINKWNASEVRIKEWLDLGKKNTLPTINGLPFIIGDVHVEKHNKNSYKMIADQGYDFMFLANPLIHDDGSQKYKDDLKYYYNCDDVSKPCNISPGSMESFKMILDIVRMINDGSISETRWELLETIRIYDYDVFVLKINSKRVNKVENIVKKKIVKIKKELENKLQYSKKNLETEILPKQKSIRGVKCEGAYGAANAAWDNYCLGELISSDGTKYVGEFLGHIKNGKGTLTYSNGNIYVGDFVNNNPHGFGTLTSKDGTKYVGDFIGNIKNGKGTLTYSNGNIYVGDFVNNNPHGFGVLTYTDGSEEAGIFEENVYVGVE